MLRPTKIRNREQLIALPQITSRLTDRHESVKSRRTRPVSYLVADIPRGQQKHLMLPQSTDDLFVVNPARQRIR